MTTVMIHELRASGRDQPAERLLRAAPAQMYQAVNAAGAAIHELLFVNTLGMSSGSYTATEAANVVAAN
jgi:hypothetical protein